MLAIYIVTLLVLMGSEILPSKVHAGSIDSRDSSVSSDSRDDDCRKAMTIVEAIENKIKYLILMNKPLPTCTSGTISKIEIINAKSGGTKTLLICSGCTGSHVSIASSTECKNGPAIFQPDLDKYCQIVYPYCINVRVYSCRFQAASTTEAPTIPGLTTEIITPEPIIINSSTLPTTISAPPPPITTQGNPATVVGNTPILDPGYGGYTYV